MAHHPTVPPDWSGGQDNSIPLPPLLLQELVEALRSIRYGAIELVIHAGRELQLELRDGERLELGGAERRRG